MIIHRDSHDETLTPSSIAIRATISVLGADIITLFSFLCGVVPSSSLIERIYLSHLLYFKHALSQI